MSKAGALGNVQTSATGASDKSWVCELEGIGVAGTGCDSGEVGASQQLA